MANVVRDDNWVTSIGAKSNADTSLIPLLADSITSRLLVDTSVSSATLLERGGVNDVEEPSATLTYVGKELADATWIVIKIDESSDTAIQYATEINNSGTTTYSTAWTNRASLVYGDYSVAF